MDRVPILRGRVTEDGRLQLRSDERSQRQRHLRNLAGKDVEVVIRRARTKRSLDQNAWLWGVAYPPLADTLGYDKHEVDDMHYALIEKCFGTHWDPRLRAMVPNKRSSELTTKEFSDYMEWLVRFGAQLPEAVHIYLPGESDAA